MALKKNIKSSKSMNFHLNEKWWVSSSIENQTIKSSFLLKEQMKSLFH